MLSMKNRKNQSDLEALQARARKAISEPTLGASVTSIDDAKGKRNKIAQAKKKVEDALAAAKTGKDEGEVTHPLTELTCLRLHHLNDKKRRADEAVRAPIVAEAQKFFDDEVAKLKKNVSDKLAAVLIQKLKEDEPYQAANKAYVDAINAVLDEETPKLPVGYSVHNLDPDKQVLKATWNPAAVGKRLDASE
jgi:hypothetical protein